MPSQSESGPSLASAETYRAPVPEDLWKRARAVEVAEKTVTVTLHGNTWEVFYREAVAPSIDVNSIVVHSDTAPTVVAPNSSAPASSDRSVTVPSSSAPNSSGIAATSPKASSPNSSSNSSSKTSSSNSSTKSSSPNSSAPKRSPPSTSAPSAAVPSSKAPPSPAPKSSAPYPTIPSATSPNSRAPTSTSLYSAAPSSKTPSSKTPSSKTPSSKSPHSKTSPSTTPSVTTPNATTPSSIAPPPTTKTLRRGRGLETLVSEEPLPPVILLHGARFTSWLWEDGEVIQLIAAMGHRVIALDLPGYGETTKNPVETQRKGEFLARFLHRARVNTALPVLISPSGAEPYVLPYLLAASRRLADYRVLAALLVSPGWPKSLLDSSSSTPTSTDIPALVLFDSAFPGWGKAEGRIRGALPRAQYLEVSGGQAMGYPAHWHAPSVIVNFLRIHCSPKHAH